jgi:hypothetical protein
MILTSYAVIEKSFAGTLVILVAKSFFFFTPHPDPLTSRGERKKGGTFGKWSRLQLIVIPGTPACQAHGSGTALTRIMKAVVFGKFNKQFFGKRFCAIVRQRESHTNLQSKGGTGVSPVQTQAEACGYIK